MESKDDTSNEDVKGATEEKEQEPEAAAASSNSAFPERKTRRASVVHHTPFLGRLSFGSTWDRRKQTLAAFTCSLYFMMPMIPLCWYLAYTYTIFPWTTLPMLCYLGYIFLFDSSPTSGRYWPWACTRFFAPWWNHACDYFPVVLVKTAELPPDQSYVLGYHPHGIIRYVHTKPNCVTFSVLWC